MPITTRHLDEFIKLKCAPQLLKLFPNAKEITESMGAFNAVRKIMGAKNFPREDVLCLIPGDGHSPRTGAMFACRTKWNVVSIDPNISTDRCEGFRRLNSIKKKVEDVEEVFDSNTVVIVAVHSHAPLHHLYEKVNFKDRCFVVAIPCCCKQFIEGIEPTKVYKDPGIYSIKNDIYVWDITRKNEKSNP